MNRLTLENIRPSDFYRMEKNYEGIAEDRESRKREEGEMEYLKDRACPKCGEIGALSFCRGYWIERHCRNCGHDWMEDALDMPSELKKFKEAP